MGDNVKDDINYWIELVKKNPKALFEINRELGIGHDAIAKYNILIENAIEAGYVFSTKDIKKALDHPYELSEAFKHSEAVLKQVINGNIKNIRYFPYFRNESYYSLAFEKGFRPTILDLNNKIFRMNLCSCPEIMEYLVSKKGSYITKIRFNPKDEKLFKLALENGYKPKTKDIIDNSILSRSSEIM